jgi:DNA-directed RNA polymerase specialized sigma24 family protein
MFSSSPSDLVWVIGFTPQGRWIAPVVRAAIRVEWPEAQQMAFSQLGDETLAPELMELAIQQTAEYLADRTPVGVDETRTILSRFYRNAVRRRKRADQRLLFRGAARDIEFLTPPTQSFESSVEAEIDLGTILDETTPDLQLAMLMRYGARSSWKDVAKETAKSIDAIRMGCRREVSRIRKKFGLRDRAK